ncbi:hypothetical protein KDE12_00510 [Campylobacter sp. faydin G-105]|nr:hypothetical protein [Campylobacter anatolicus]MBR8461336.1 hypothetical protein [Campylobacter anatolicus]
MKEQKNLRAMGYILQKFHAVMYIKSNNKDYESFELDKDTQNCCYS